MLFPTAGVEVAPWVPPLVAFVISLFTSMGGVSGAFLLLPFQMSFLGYTTPSVSATNQLYNIVAIPAGVYRYVREGRMVWPLTLAIVAGTLPGVILGALVRVAYLPDPRHFKLFAALVLLYIGARLVIDLVRGKAGEGSGKDIHEIPVHDGEASTPAVGAARLSLAAVEYEFLGRSHRVPTPAILALSFTVGIFSGVYGIGGGAIIAPFLVSFFRLPVHTIAGATLMGTFVTSIAAVAFYSAIAPFFPGTSVSPDWLLGLLFGIGGMAGMYIGARLQKRVPARLIRWMLAAIIVYTAASYVRGFFVR